MNMRWIPVLAILGLLPAAVAEADTVVLKGGTELQGVVLDPAADAKPALPDRGDVSDHPSVRLLLPKGDEVRLEGTDVLRVEWDSDAPALHKHLRYKEPKKDVGGGLEVAVTTYVPKDGGPRIDLVSAVHIADGAYYRECQQLLEAADIVLYEAVKPKDTTAEEMQKPVAPEDNPIRGMQVLLAEWLDLEFQLDAIEYGRPHFVHADLTVEELTGAPATPEGVEGDEPANPADPGSTEPDTLQGLTGGAAMFRNMIQAAINSGESNTRMWRAFLARMLGTVDASALLSQVVPNLTETLVDRRNEVVIERVVEWAPKAKDSIAVFYGAAHMPDLEKRLVELGYRRAGARWIRAWHIE